MKCTRMVIIFTALGLIALLTIILVFALARYERTPDEIPEYIEPGVFIADRQVEPEPTP